MSMARAFAQLVRHETAETAERAVDDLVVVGEFRDPI
jgi:hypothetical protein